MSFEEVAVLLPDLTLTLRANLSDWYGIGATIISSPDVRMREWSVFVRYQIELADLQRRAILVKIRRHPDQSISDSISSPGLKEEGRNDYEALKAIENFVSTAENIPGGNNTATPYGYFSDEEKDHFCAVRPLAFFDPFSALVMEELEARPLRSMILNFKTAYHAGWQEQLSAWFYRSGRWLRVYHEQLGKLHEGPFFGDDIHAALEKSINAIEPFHDFDFTPVRKVLQKTSAAYKDRSLSFGLLHWNFDCANFLVAEDNRIGILDPHFIDGPIYMDIAKIMTDLQTYRLQTLSYGLFIREKVMQKFHRSILQGYFGSEQPDEVAVNLYCIYAVLDKWQIDEEAEHEHGKEHGWLHQFIQSHATWRRKYFMKLLSAYVDRLQKLLP